MSLRNVFLFWRHHHPPRSAIERLGMQLPRRAQEIIDTFYGLHRTEFERDDDTRRAMMLLIAEQLAFELGPFYGCKSAGAGRPQGQSTIAYNGGPSLGGWRILDGDGSVTGIVNAPIPNPPWQEFVGQQFISVTPTDHLGIAPNPPAPAPAPVPITPQPVPAPTPLPPSTTPPVVEPPSPVPSTLSNALSALGAWLGTQAVNAVLAWWTNRKKTPTKPAGTVETAIPRPVPPTRRIGPP